MSRPVKVASGLNVILGSWLIIAPFVLGCADLAARLISIITGTIVVILTWMRLANPATGSGMSWVNGFWGKKHTLKAADLRLLCPRWDDFQQIRRQVDPNGVFLNDYLRNLLCGV